MSMGDRGVDRSELGDNFELVEGQRTRKIFFSTQSNAFEMLLREDR